jgi:D-3-phosphoglycerate dehydrogenase
MTNKSRGSNAYTLIECSGTFDKDAIEQIKAIEGMRRVRMITRA